jgi:hypothetical protein
MTSLRTLLVWLLLLAIPLQGFAAASSALCAAARTPLAGQVAASMDQGHCAEPDNAAPDSAAKCSNCAFCCVGIAIAPAWAALTGARALASEPIAYAAMHVTAHIPGGLERPPHSPIA